MDQDQIRTDALVEPPTLMQRRCPVNVMERIEALKAKHAALDDAIQEENNRPHPDDVRIHDLKRQKLKIKDEIAYMSRH